MKIHLETYGHGPCLVMVHGWAMHSGVWRAFAQQLASRIQVVLVDLPGHGLSEPLARFELDDVASALLDAIPVTRFHLLGWSLGGLVATEMARQAPQRVQGLQLLAANPRFVADGDWPGVAPKVLQQFALQMQGDIAQMLNRFLALQVNGLPHGRSLLAQLKQSMPQSIAPDTANLQGGLTVLAEADLRPVLQALSCPLAVLYGDRDTLIPTEVASSITRLRPDARLHYLPGAGHVPFLTHPAALKSMILASMTADSVKRQVRRSFADAAATYDGAAELQREVGLQLIRNFPLTTDAGWVVDLGSGTGFIGRQLPRNAQQQPLCSVDLAEAMLVSCETESHKVVGDAEHLPFADCSVQQIYASLSLQWCLDLTVAVREALRVLQGGGRFVFSTLADGTLQELKQAWRVVDQFAHVNAFLTLPQIEQSLRQVGAQHYQIKTQTIQMRHPDVLSLMHELKALGARTVQAGRKRHPTTRRQLQAVMQAYPRQADGAVLATYQVVYVVVERQEAAD